MNKKYANIIGINKYTLKNLVKFFSENFFSNIKIKEKLIIVKNIILLLWYNKIDVNKKIFKIKKNIFLFLKILFSKIKIIKINNKAVLDRPEDLGELYLEKFLNFQVKIRTYSLHQKKIA